MLCFFSKDFSFIQKRQPRLTNATKVTFVPCDDMSTDTSSSGVTVRAPTTPRDDVMLSFYMANVII